MATNQEQLSKDKAEHLLSLLKPEQRELVEARRGFCGPCSQNSGLGTATVRCKACGCAGVSLIHGRCRLRKWPAHRDGHGNTIGMPPAPPVKPEPTPWMGRPATPHAAHMTADNTAGAAGGGNELFVYGFPGLYAGASTELHHQIILWRSMGITVHLIPGDIGYRNEPLYPEMIERGVIVHEADQFDAITPGSPVLGFCNDRFLARIDEILLYSHNTVFVNCMTWLFEQEKIRHHEGKIAAYLYQNDEVRQENGACLQEINPDPKVQFLTFKPYFDSKAFPFVDRASGENETGKESFVLGRISRQDADKFSSDTLNIWERIESPLRKRGVMLGFGPDSENKIGKPPQWVRTYRNQTELSQQDFYRQVDVIVQPMDTTENWPRIGLEAMASGCVLIVDNRGGWRQMIEHGKTGWLCDSSYDYVRYATRMAYEPEERAAIANAAYKKMVQCAGKEASQDSWAQVLSSLGIEQNLYHVAECRKTTCIKCSYARGLRETSVQCGAIENEVSLVHGRCKLRKWEVKSAPKGFSHKAKHVECRVFEGLTNRLNGIASALATGRPVHLYWAINQHCPIHFSQVFKPMHRIQVIEEYKDHYAHAVTPDLICWFYPRNMERVADKIFRERIYASYEYLWNHLLIEGSPSKIPKRTLGIHYRHFLPDVDSYSNFSSKLTTVIDCLSPEACYVASDDDVSREEVIKKIKPLVKLIDYGHLSHMRSDLDRNPENVKTLIQDLSILRFCQLGVLTNSSRSTVPDILRCHGIKSFMTYDDGMHRHHGRDDLFEREPVESLLKLNDISSV